MLEGERTQVLTRSGAEDGGEEEEEEEEEEEKKVKKNKKNKNKNKNKNKKASEWIAWSGDAAGEQEKDATKMLLDGDISPFDFAHISASLVRAREIMRGGGRGSGEGRAKAKPVLRRGVGPFGVAMVRIRASSEGEGEEGEGEDEGEDKEQGMADAERAYAIVSTGRAFRIIVPGFRKSARCAQEGGGFCLSLRPATPKPRALLGVPFCCRVAAWPGDEGWLVLSPRLVVANATPFDLLVTGASGRVSAPYRAPGGGGGFPFLSLFL